MSKEEQAIKEIQEAFGCDYHYAKDLWTIHGSADVAIFAEKKEKPKEKK